MIVVNKQDGSTRQELTMSLAIDQVTDLHGAASPAVAGPLVWQRTDTVGTELVFPADGGSRSAEGTAVVAGPLPYATRFHAALDTDSAVRALRVTTSGDGWTRTLRLGRAADGGWTKREVPVAPGSTQRTKLVFDRGDNAYLVMPYGRIVAASKASGWTDWTTLFDRPAMNVFGEVNVSLAGDVLSVQYQQKSSGTTPSPIRVADFRIG